MAACPDEHPGRAPDHDRRALIIAPERIDGTA
jgi:hypothetical protein